MLHIKVPYFGLVDSHTTNFINPLLTRLTLSDMGRGQVMNSVVWTVVFLSGYVAADGWSKNLKLEGQNITVKFSDLDMEPWTTYDAAKNGSQRWSGYLPSVVEQVLHLSQNIHRIFSLFR